MWWMVSTRIATWAVGTCDSVTASSCGTMHHTPCQLSRVHAKAAGLKVDMVVVGDDWCVDDPGVAGC